MTTMDESPAREKRGGRKKRRRGGDDETPDNQQEQPVVPSQPVGGAPEATADRESRIASPATWTAAGAAASTAMSTAGVVGGATGMLIAGGVGAGGALGGMALRKYAPGVADRAGLRKREKNQREKTSTKNKDGGLRDKLARFGSGRRKSTRGHGSGDGSDRKGLLGKLFGGRGGSQGSGGGRKARHGHPGPGGSHKGSRKGLLGKLGLGGRKDHGGKGAGRDRSRDGSKGNRKGLLGRLFSGRGHDRSNKSSGSKDKGGRKGLLGKLFGGRGGSKGDKSKNKHPGGSGKDKSKGHSKWNPKNWFGRGASKGTDQADSTGKNKSRWSRLNPLNRFRNKNKDKSKGDKSSSDIANKVKKGLVWIGSRKGDTAESPGNAEPNDQPKKTSGSVTSTGSGKSDQARASAAAGKSGHGTSDGSTEMNPFESHIEQVKATASNFHVSKANDLIDWVDHAPQAAAVEAESWRQQGMTIQEEIPIQPAFAEALVTFANAKQALATQIHERAQQFRAEHAAELQRLNDPRPGADKWDISANRD